jgi:hypothetical protein
LNKSLKDGKHSGDQFIRLEMTVAVGALAQNLAAFTKSRPSGANHAAMRKDLEALVEHSQMPTINVCRHWVSESASFALAGGSAKDFCLIMLLWPVDRQPRAESAGDEEDSRNTFLYHGGL